MTTFHLAQQAEPLVLISYVKPLLAFALLLAWGRAVTQFNKDAGYFYLKQHLFNGVQIACEPIPDFLRVLLRAGGLVPHLKARFKAQQDSR